MLTLLLSSSLIIHSCYPKPNVNETPPDLWEPSEIHQLLVDCPKEKIGCS